MHCPRAPTLEPSKGLRPQNRHSQKPKSETVFVSGVLPVLVGPAWVSFPGSGLWFFFPVPVCFCLFFLSPSVSFHWPRASRSSSRMGGTLGQTHGHRPKNRWRRRPKNPLFQVSLYARPSTHAELLGFRQSGARCPPPRGEEYEQIGFLQTSTTFGSAPDTVHASVLSRFAASTSP